MTKYSVLAIIPARGGSKRIPKKNIISFSGKPMIAWTIEAILKSKIASDVIVSTDCPEIRDVAIKYGASVPFLRDAYSDDFSTVSQVTEYTQQKVESYYNKKYDHIIQLMPNCPLRNHDVITSMYDFFCSKKLSALLSCFKFGWMNPWWSFKIDKGNVHNYLFPGALKKRSQDLDDLYCPTGAVWMANAEQYKLEKNFYMPGHQFYPIPWQAALDIDNYEDLEMALAVKQTMCDTNLDIVV